MAVIPFTYLKAGVWELRCSGDLISDIMGKSWRYGVHLQVKPQLAEAVEPVLEPENNLEIISDPISDEKPSSNPEVELVITQESYFLDQDDTAIDQPVNPVWVKGETAEQILQNLIDLALPGAESLLEELKVEDTPKEERSLPLLLTLDQETYITRWGHLLTIHGSVELQKNLEPADEARNIKNLYGLELRIELRSPQSSEVLTQIRQSLGDKSLPLTIRSTFNIPADCESKLILADINLYGAVANAKEAALLASHSFTITADVADLLAVKNAVQASLVDEQNHTTSPAEPSTSIDLELFNLVKTPPIPSQPTYVSVSTPLPQAIDPESLNKQTDLRVPQLPKLPETPIEATVTNDLIAEPSLDIPPLELEETTIPQTPAPIDLGKLVIKQRLRFSGSTLPYLKRLPATPSFNEVTTSEVTEELPPSVAEELPQVEVAITEPKLHLEEVLNDKPIQDETVTELEAEPTPETIAALETEEIVDTSTTESATPPTQLNENVTQIISITPPRPYSSPLIRKWMESQGYTLPEIFTDSNEIPQEQVTPEESPTVQPIAETPDLEDTLPPVPDVAIEPLEIELVPPEAIEYQPSVDMEDDAPEPPPLEPELPPTEPIQTPLIRIAQEIVLDDSDDEVELEVNNKPLPKAEQAIDSPAKILEPLPTPQLYVPDGELVAGKQTRIRVELPKVSPQVVVKLWMEDCQTRWLLDGPHILTELLPNSSGNVEVMTQLNIPFGCLEIRIEAIALNTVTKQESHKVTIIKTVIPPDLPNVSLNDLLGM
jgi:hypothetical protein